MKSIKYIYVPIIAIIVIYADLNLKLSFFLLNKLSNYGYEFFCINFKKANYPLQISIIGSGIILNWLQSLLYILITILTYALIKDKKVRKGILFIMILLISVFIYLSYFISVLKCN